MHVFKNFGMVSFIQDDCVIEGKSAEDKIQKRQGFAVVCFHAGFDIRCTKPSMW